MKILYDHQIFSEQRIGGISRYHVELIKNLPSGYTATNSILFSDNLYTKDMGINQISLPSIPEKRRIYRGFSRLYSIYRIKKNDFDVFHPTSYDPYFLQYLKKPYVTTVHDLIHEKISGVLNPGDKYTLNFKRKAILNATKLIAISECTKKDLMEIYGIEESRIAVVYHGHSIIQSSAESVKDAPHNYILFVGGRLKYKNFQRFLEAFALINKEHKDIHLICTGIPFTKEERDLIEDLGLTGKVRQLFATDGQLTWLYQNALCFVFPSLYEGFGIPILESFASNCPIALSNASCFPEIAKDGGAYFDPLDHVSMAETIKRVIEDSQYREHLIQRGQCILTDFSWEKAARQTADVYKTLV